MEIVQAIGWVCVGSFLVALSTAFLVGAAALVRVFWRT